MSGPLLTNLKLTLILTTHSMLTHYFVEVLTHSLTHSLTPFRFRSFVLDLPASHDLSHWWTACFFPFGQRIPAIAIDISPLVASLNGCLDLTHEMVCHQSLKGAASTSQPIHQSTTYFALYRTKSNFNPRLSILLLSGSPPPPPMARKSDDALAPKPSSTHPPNPRATDPCRSPSHPMKRLHPFGPFGRVDTPPRKRGSWAMLLSSIRQKAGASRGGGARTKWINDTTVTKIIITN